MDGFLRNDNLLPESSVDSDDGTWNPMGNISINDSKVIDDSNSNLNSSTSILNLSSYTDPYNATNPTLPIDVRADDIINKFANMFKKQTEETAKVKRQKPMETYTKPTKEEYGLNINKLKKWNDKKILKKTSEDENRQEIALFKVKQFMDAIFLIIKLQAWWRMNREVMRYEVWRAERRKIKRLYYSAWKRQVKAEKSYLHQVLGKPFEAWATEVQDTKNLRILVRDFFLLCIKRLRLTPQAVMAYFSPQEWGASISEGDQNKIRRLVLSKLFSGWRSEIRFLRNNRFKASQILTRVMRRSKGPLWVKETTLVCFHVWRRYGAVRKAYKLQLPEPRFGAPYLPQWTKLLQTVTLQRIARKRAAEKGEMLVYIRTFRRWTFIMTVDRTQSANPEAIAESHNRRVILKRVVLAWQTILRERGTIVRVRNRCFYKWQKWAPTRHRMTALKKATKTWLDARRTYNAFYAMQVQCFELISRVISKVKLLRSKCLDRKVIMCAYALLNRDSCVIALDCWRRWKLYWQGRIRWRKASLQYNYMWHSGRMRVLFSSWKYFVDNKMGNSRPSTRQLKERNKRMSMKSIGIESSNYDDDPDIDSKVSDNNTINTDDHSLDRESLESIERSNAGRSNMASPSSSTTRIAQQIDEEVPLVPGIAQHAFNHFENMRNLTVTDPKLPFRKMYHLFYHCLSRAHNRQAQLRKENVSNSNGATSDADDLKIAIDRLDIDGAMTLVEKGAVVESSHIQQVAKYLGDEYIPLFCYLVSKCPSYMAERMSKGDRRSELNHCSNPINALALASHIKRWEKCQLSRRELTVFEDTSMNEELCSSYNSVILWRSAVMLLLRKKADDIQSTCVILPESRTVEKEVVEAMKRKKLLRLRQVREGVRGILNLREDRTSQLLKEIPQLVLTGPAVKPQVEIDEWILGLDINSLLHEYAMIKGKLSEEVNALRMPLVYRDDKLIENGKLKQARADFLLLRRSCMTKEELLKEQQKIDEKKEKKRKAEREKQYKEAMVRRKLKMDAEKKAKKAARAAAIAKKKADKARKRAGLPASTEEVKEAEIDEEKEKMDDVVASLLADEYDSEEDDAIIALHALQEEEDIKREELFQSRTSHIGQFIFETWIAPTVRDNEENSKILCERADMEAKDAFNRLLRMIREGGIHITKNQRVIDGHGGIGGWLISASFNHPKIMTESVFKGLVPLSWWNVIALFERTKKEIMLVEAYMFILEAKFEKNYKEDDAIDFENNKLKKFLASTREDVLQVAKRKNKKIEDEKAERVKKGRSLDKLKKQIDDINKKIKATNEKVKKADIMLATSNIDGVYTVFNIEPITVNNDEDKERLRFTAYDLVEKNRNLIPEFEQQIQEIHEEIARINQELYSFDSFCQRGTNLLRDLAESRFTTMLEVQQLVNRSSKRQYTLRADSTIEFKFLTKIKTYLNILKGFLGIVNRYQNRVLQQLTEEKSESMVFDSVDNVDNVDNVDSVDSMSIANSFINEEDEVNRHPNIIIDDDFMNVHSPTKSDSINMNADIDNLWLGIGQLMGPRPVSPPKIEDDDDDERDDKFDDTATLQSGHSNSTTTVTASVKRRLTKHEQIELEQQMATIAAEKAEIADTNEMRARTFDEYWIAVMPPKKKKKEKPEKKKKEVKADIEVKAETPPSLAGPLVVLGKTSNLWKSVGTTYRRDRKERILTELETDSDINNEAAKTMYKTRRIPAEMNYDTPVWKVHYNHKVSVSMSATEHPDILEEQAKKNEKKYGSRGRKDVVAKDPFTVVGMHEYERMRVNYDNKYDDDNSRGSPTTKSMESFYLQDNPQYSNTDSDSDKEDDNKKLIDDDVVVVDINSDAKDIVIDDEDDVNQSNQLEDVFTDSTIIKTYSDTLTNVDVTLVTEKSNEIPYHSSPSSSSSLNASSSPLLVSTPLSAEAPLQQTSSPSPSSSLLLLPDTNKSVKSDTDYVSSARVHDANIDHGIASSSIDSSIIDNNITTDTVIIPNPNTVTSIDLGSDSRLYVETNSNIRYGDKLNDSDSECPSPVIVNNNKTATSILELLPEKEDATNNDSKIDRNKQDDVSDSDFSDDEQSIPIPISFVSVSQVSGEIVATKGEPSVNLSTFSAELPVDNIKNNKAVKFDESIEKSSLVSLVKSTDKSRDDIKWHLADQPKAVIAKPEDILVLGSSLFETSLEDAPIVTQERVLTPGGSLSERLGLSSASPQRSPVEGSLAPRTPGGSLLSQIEQSIRQISEGSLRASQEVLDKISIHDDNDDDEDNNYMSFTINDLEKIPISMEGAHSRPSTQYTNSVTLDLNKVADAIDQLKHEYHDDPPSFVNKPIPMTDKVEIAQKIRNTKAAKMTIPDKRSNPQYIKLNGYNVSNDFSIDRDGGVIPADYSKKIKMSKFKKNKEDSEQVKRAEDLKYNALLGHSFSQPLLGSKSNVNNTNSNSTSNIDIYDMNSKAPDVYVNQLLYNNDDDILKLAYAVVLGLDKKHEVDISTSPKFAEGLVKAQPEPLSSNEDEGKEYLNIELDDSLVSSSIASTLHPPEVVFDDFFDHRSSLKTPVMSLRDYAVSRQGSRGQPNSSDNEGVVVPPFLASSSSLPSSPNYDRYLLKSRQTPLSLEPLKAQPLIPLTFGFDDDDEANLENELRALLRNTERNINSNANTIANTNTNTDINVKTSSGILPPLKQDKPKTISKTNINSNGNGRVKITNGTLLRSLSLASPRLGVDSNMLVSGTMPKVKSTYVSTSVNKFKPPQSLVSLSVSSSVDSKLKRVLKSDITIATTNSNITHTFSDILDDMSARGSVNSTTNSLQLEGSFMNSTDMKVEVSKKKKKNGKVDIGNEHGNLDSSNVDDTPKKKKSKSKKKKTKNNDNGNDNDNETPKI